MTEPHQGNTYVILGADQLALAVMDALAAGGEPIALVNRSGNVAEPLPQAVTVLQADLTDADAVERVARGAHVVFFCASPPYEKWPELFPPMARSVLEGVARTHARLVFGDNLYMYGPTGGAPIREDLPYNATGSKGMARAEVATVLMDAHRSGKVEVAIGRASDFFGPRVTNSTFGERVFGAALEGKTVNLLGNIDLPHTYTYIRDFAAALVTLATHDESFGEVWHVPNPPTLTTRQWLDLISEQVGHPLQTRTAGKWMLTALGLFNPALREMKEMLYEFEEPYVVDDTKFRQAFGAEATEPKAAIEETLDWYRRHRIS